MLEFVFPSILRRSNLGVGDSVTSSDFVFVSIALFGVGFIIQRDG